VLAGYPWVHLIASGLNLGFAGGANLGIRATGSELVATLNPDVTLRPGWARALGDAFAADAWLGAAGGKLLYPDGATIQHAGGQIDQPLLVAHNRGRGEPDRGQYDQPAEVEFLTGGALLLRRRAVDQIGLFDEAFNPAYYEDVDLCVRLRAAGWAVRYLPAATGLHREGSSTGGASPATARLIHAARLRFAAKHLPLGDLIGRFLPAEAARLAAELRHLSEPAAADRAGLSVFPAALLRRPAPATAPAPPAAPRLLASLTVEVGRRWRVREQPFASHVPLVGPVIAWLRARVNDAGPRWHVLRLLEQQVEFNAAVYRALAETGVAAEAAALADEASAAVLAERLEALAAQQAELAARLADLERRLTALARDRPPPPAASA
jgi:GT2 family glycosyltransferase